MTQEELAKVTKMPQSYISRYANGKLRITADVLLKIKNSLELDTMDDAYEVIKSMKRKPRR